MKRKIKLIFFHPYSDVGGADNSLYRLISNLSLSYFSITFISLNKSFLQKKLSKKIDFIKLKSSRSIFSIIEIKKLLKRYKQEKKYKKIILISNQNFANLIAIFATLLIFIK